LDVKPVVPPEVQAELQTLRNQAQELERRSAEADRRATEAEKELQNLAGQRAIETVTSGRRIAELEAEIRALKNTLTQHETEAATVQQQFKDHLVGDLNAKLESRREELARYYENEFASVENRLKDLKVRREELARYFETEQAVAEARIQDIRERQKALKN
jgi:phage-related minor tail protein